MCGIAALMGIGEARVEPLTLRQLADALSHRGPDDEGFVLIDQSGGARELGGPASAVAGLPSISEAAADRPVVGLANRRLAILDPTPAGHGPMAAGERRVWLTYNGEVYNFVELARELESRGHRLHSRSDTEVILASYLEWGEECFERFNGMWALAIWDGRRNELLLSRDRLGIKPLYWTQADGIFAVASEPRALLTLGLSRRVDRAMAYGFLSAGYSDWGDRTFFEDIGQVEPGTVVTVDRGGRRRTRRFWSVADAGRGALRGDEAVEHFRSLFLDAVRLQLRSDVPVGTCLSGGLDSSSIATAIARERVPGQAQHAFSAVFPGQPFDESRYVRTVARAAGLTEHRVTPTEEEFLRDLDQLVLEQGEPFPSSSTYAQYRVMKLAHDAGVKVVLDGQGGDELLAGYTGFMPMAAADAVRAFRPFAAAHELRGSGGLNAGNVARTLLALAPEAVGRQVRRSARRKAAAFVGADLEESSHARVEAVERGGRSLDGALRRALGATALPVLLRSEDRSSMANSVEARVPFLDHRLVELALQLPNELKLHRGRTKVVLRQALADLLPQEILDRRDKIGFATPELAWLRSAGPLIADVAARADGTYVTRDGVRRLHFRVSSGDEAAAAPLWRAVCFERWRSLYSVD